MVEKLTLPSDQGGDDLTLPSDTPAGPQIGGGQAAWEGFKSGVSFGTSDQLSGLAQTAPTLGSDVDAGAMAFMTPEQHVERIKAADEQYRRAEATARATREDAQAQHPLLFGAGEFGGAAATLAIPVGGELASGAGMGVRAARAAKVGAGFGAAAGAGYGQREGGLPGAVEGAGIGAVTGAGIGAVSEPVMSAAGALVRPVTSAFRTLRDPEAEASRQLLQAAQGDIAGIGRGEWQPLTQEQIAAANQAGLQRTPLDILGPRTRALGEWAATQSPEAAANIKNLAEERFRGQPQRVSDFIQDMTGGSDLYADKAAIEEGARAVNRPAYIKAYDAGDRPIWSPELERLTSSPTVAGALRGAVNKWRDFQVRDNFGAVNPPLRVTPDGILEATGGKGMPPYPNLQLWDYTRRTLSGLAEGAKGEFGRPTELSTLYGDLARGLNTELDRLVPEYGDARAGAAQFFGAKNALQAGAKFAGPQNNFAMGNARAALSRMTDDERALFARGYATEQANRVLRGGANVRSLDLPQTQQRTAMALGQDNANRLQALVKAENVVNSTRNLYSGSPTARRIAMLTGMGVGFGAGEGTLETLATGHFDPYHALTAAMLAGTGAGNIALKQRLAKQIGSMIISDDPAIYRKGIEILSKNPGFMSGIAKASVPLAGRMAVGKQLNPALLQPAAADEQANVPGKKQQQNAGGRVNRKAYAAGGRVSGDVVHGDPPAFDPRSIGARKATNNHWYVSDPARSGRFLLVLPSEKSNKHEHG